VAHALASSPLRSGEYNSILLQSKETYTVIYRQPFIEMITGQKAELLHIEKGYFNDFQANHKISMQGTS
jgi:hypothetical protein